MKIKQKNSCCWYTVSYNRYAESNGYLLKQQIKRFKLNNLIRSMALLSIAAERGRIAALSGKKQQNTMQCSNAERLEKAAEAGAMRVKAGAFHLKLF